jgi:putative spermidine/putrescine transport system permease protein
MKKNRLSGRIFLIVLGTYLLIPFIATVIYSLFIKWNSVLPEGFTLRNYTELFGDAEFWASIGRTLILCAGSVFITIVLLLLAMYAVIRSKQILGKVMQVVCMIPYALQGVILSVSVISLYAGTGTILSNRLFMLFGTYTVLVLPYIYQGIRNSINAINAEMLMETASVLGCGPFKAYLKVIIPNIIPGIMISSLLAESIVFGDFVLANNIAGNNYQNIQVYLNQKMSVSSGLSSAIVTVIFAVVMIISWIILHSQKETEKEGKR